MNTLFRYLVLLSLSCHASAEINAIPTTTTNPTTAIKPEYVTLGIYILSVHDINFVNGTFGADFWIWANYNDPQLQPMKTLELINAKSYTEMLPLTQDKNHFIWSQKKIQGTFRYHWNMTNFPFDMHRLTIIIEESQDDIDKLLYKVDLKNSKYDKNIHIPGFIIKNLTFETIERHYDTNFGEPTATPSSTYSALTINLELERVSMLLFIKMHATLYIAFLITALCFPLLAQIPKTPQMINAIFSAMIGSTFAVVINLRASDGIIGYSETLTLVDRLHILTLIYFVLLGTVAIIVLVAREKWSHQNLLRFIFWADGIYLSSYIMGNIFLVWQAASASFIK